MKVYLLVKKNIKSFFIVGIHFDYSYFFIVVGEILVNNSHINDRESSKMNMRGTILGIRAVFL